MWKNYIKKHNNGCWTWTGSTNNSGSPVAAIGRTAFHPAKALFKEEFGVEFPASQHIKRWCSTTGCIAPKHIYWVKEKDRSEAAYRDEVLSKLLDRMVIMENGCWLWRYSMLPTGYSRVSFYARSEYAHRVAYLLMIGEIPDGKEIDHLCRNRCCINPVHLEAVTHKENLHRSPRHVAHGDFVIIKKGECQRGHGKFTDNNTYRTGPDTRTCKECAKDRHKKFYTNNKEYRERQKKLARERYHRKKDKS